MNDFIYNNPVQLNFGVDILGGLGRQAAAWGKKALIVTSKFFLKETGALRCIQDMLASAGVDCMLFPKVGPNPRLSLVEEGVQVCREKGIELLVALGGGSAIDCAKAIGFCVFEKGDLWDFFDGKRTAQKSLPLICISTVAASGSEMNANCVITNEKTRQKYVTRFPCCFPKASFVDVELHKTLPAYNTACGMVDTITHVLEKYFDGTADTPLQDRFAEGVVLTIMENEGVLSRPDDAVLRKNLALASIYALNGVCDAGRGKGNFDAHTIELELSARYDLAHGAGLAIIYPAWMRHLCRKNPEKFAQFARRVFNTCGTESRSCKAGMEGIEALRETFLRWNMPGSLKAVGVPQGELESMAERIVRSPKGLYLDKEEVYEVLCDCHE